MCRCSQLLSSAQASSLPLSNNICAEKGRADLGALILITDRNRQQDRRDGMK